MGRGTKRKDVFKDSGKGVVRGMSCEGPRETNEKVNGLVIQHYGDRYFALYAGEDLICVTVYRKGAMEVKRRLEAAHSLTEKPTE